MLKKKEEKKKRAILKQINKLRGKNRKALATEMTRTSEGSKRHQLALHNPLRTIIKKGKSKHTPLSARRG